MSGRTLFLLGLALFVLGFLLYGVTEDFTTSKVITVAGFWGGLFTMIAGGDRWWREPAGTEERTVSRHVVKSRSAPRRMSAAAGQIRSIRG
jgi:hypothetical protein